LLNRPREKKDKVQNESQAPDVKPIKSDATDPPVDWLRGCEICNTGLCRKMDELTGSSKKGGVGLPIREAAKRLEKQATERIGEQVWTAEQIRARYLYYTGKMNAGRNSTTPEKLTPSVEKTDQPPDPIPQEGAGREREYPHTETHEVTYAMQFAIMAISQLERIGKDDPRKEDALTEVELWILKHRGRPADLESLKVLYKTFLDAAISFQHRHRHRKRAWRKQLSEIVGWIQNMRTLTNTWAEQIKDK
jgi:hypothetical protein